MIRTADLGLRAAGREHDPEAAKLMLSKALLNRSAVSRCDLLVQVLASDLDFHRSPRWRRQANGSSQALCEDGQSHVRPGSHARGGAARSIRPQGCGSATG
jgi:hypothetical protein